MRYRIIAQKDDQEWYAAKGQVFPTLQSAELTCKGLAARWPLTDFQIERIQEAIEKAGRTGEAGWPDDLPFESCDDAVLDAAEGNKR